MPLRFGIPFTLLLAVVSSIASSPAGFNGYYVVIGASAAWIAYDSWRIEIRQYATQLALPPVALAMATIVAWPLLFPLYLRTRYRIARGIITRGQASSNSRRLIAVAVVLIAAFAGLWVWAVRATKPARDSLQPLATGIHREFSTPVNVTVRDGYHAIITLPLPIAPDSTREQLAFSVARYAHRTYQPELTAVTVQFVRSTRRGALTVTTTPSSYEFSYAELREPESVQLDSGGINGG